MPGNGNVGMISAGNQHCVTVPYDSGHFWFGCIGVNELDTERRIGHVEINVYLFQHRGVFMRRPARPVSGIGLSDSGNESTRLNIFGKQHVQVARASWSARAELQSGVFGNLRVTHNLQGVTIGNVGGHFRDVRVGLRRDAHRRVARNINRVVLPNLDFFLIHRYECLARKADKPRFAIPS
jgi:hypothetical protein